MYAKYKDKGLNVIAVNTQDSASAIQKFRKELKLTMPLLLGLASPVSVPKQYGIIVTPTSYVLDKNGKVVAQIIGYDEEGIKKALVHLGVGELPVRTHE